MSGVPQGSEVGNSIYTYGEQFHNKEFNDGKAFQ